MTSEQHSAATNRLLKFFKDLEANYPKQTLTKIMARNSINGVYISAISNLKIAKDGKLTKTPLNKDLAEKVIENTLILAKKKYDRKRRQKSKKTQRAPVEPKLNSVHRVSEDRPVQEQNDIHEIKGDIVAIKSFMFDILTALKNQS
jgi:hypothetical protein